MYTYGICLEGLAKTRIGYNGFPGRDLNPGRPEYEAGVLTSTPRRSYAMWKKGI